MLQYWRRETYSGSQAKVLFYKVIRHLLQRERGCFTLQKGLFYPAKDALLLNKRCRIAM